jgi:Kdo2-lipid IVA lauroyltransferase/acyltransferase
MAGISSIGLAIAGSILGTMAYMVDFRHRRIVRRNLQLVYPQWPRERINVVSRRVFHNTAITLLEFLQMASLSRGAMLRKVRIQGEKHLLEAARSPRGAIVISAHIGNWEAAHMVTACFLERPVVLVARRVRPHILNQWVNRLRGRFGGVLLDKAGALPKMARALKGGKLVGILIDQSTLRSEGVEIDFLGYRAMATPSAAILARRFNTPVLPAFCLRQKDGQLTLTVQPPLALARTNDRQADMVENTQIMNDAVAEAIRSQPDQWFWFHKRWKRHHPDLYPEDLARRRRQKATRRKQAPKT